VYDWIDQDLGNTTRPVKFVLGHAPAWSYCSNAPGYNGCINYGNNFVEDLLDPNERPRPHSICTPLTFSGQSCRMVCRRWSPTMTICSANYWSC
jgi:hypothetical protein